jgi:hypothetical protein
MSDKVIRLTSQQGFADQWTNATTPKTLSLVDFTIPSGLVVNMKKSYISFNSAISNNVDEVVNASWWLQTDGAEQFNVPNAALIRNCSISASSVGQLESITRQDSLVCGMFGLSHTAEEAKSDMNTLSAYNNGAGDSVYTSLNLDRVSNNVTNDGSTIMTGLNGAALTSSNIDRDIKVPLKDIFGVGDIEDLDTSKWGEIDIHCETNFKLLKSHQWGGNEDTLFGFDGTTPQGIMEPITLAAVGDSITTVTTGTAYGEWEYTCPFYVGQTVSLSADSTEANPPDDELGVIASIQFQTDNTATPPTGDNKVTITFESAIYTSAVINTQLSNILLKAVVDDADLVNTINRAELVLFISDVTDTPDAYEYMTYTSEQDNGNGLTSFNRGYMVEADAENVMIACINDNMILPNRTITSYRYALDNDEQTGNRDIVSNSPLQYERLQRCLNVSAQIPFKNAQLKFYRQTNTQALAYSSPISMICETLQTNGQARMLNLSIESAGLQQLILYKQIPRQISI